jgi:hypothetical protein
VALGRRWGWGKDDAQGKDMINASSYFAIHVIMISVF